MSESQIIAEEADRAGVKVVDVKWGRRTHALVAVRASSARRMRTELKLTYRDIGHALGGKDHATIMNYFPEHREVRVGTKRWRTRGRRGGNTKRVRLTGRQLPQYLTHRGAGL